MGRTSDSRQRLMDAAHELIWGYSYGAVTIEAICERARVKKGSFYYFFDSKADLAVAALNAWYTERRRTMEQIILPETPPLERLSRYLNLVVENQMQVYRENRPDSRLPDLHARFGDFHPGRPASHAGAGNSHDRRTLFRINRPRRAGVGRKSTVPIHRSRRASFGAFTKAHSPAHASRTIPNCCAISPAMRWR